MKRALAWRFCNQIAVRTEKRVKTCRKCLLCSSYFSFLFIATSSNTSPSACAYTIHPPFLSSLLVLRIESTPDFIFVKPRRGTRKKAKKNKKQSKSSLASLFSYLQKRGRKKETTNRGKEDRRLLLCGQVHSSAINGQYDLEIKVRGGLGSIPYCKSPYKSHRVLNTPTIPSSPNTDTSPAPRLSSPPQCGCFSNSSLRNYTLGNNNSELASRQNQ